MGQLGVHIVTNATYGVIGISESEITMRVGHGFIDELMELFTRMFVEPPEKLNAKICGSFEKTILETAVKFSEGGEAETGDVRTRKVKKAVDEVKGLALDNIEKVLQRGEQIDDIVDRTDDLAMSAATFETSSRTLRRKMWWNSTKGQIMIVGGIIAFLIVVYLVFCGGISCHPSGNSGGNGGGNSS